MIINYLKNLLTAKQLIYEYALSAREVKKAMVEISKAGNEKNLEFDVIGSFISETEFEYNLINIFDTNGIGITFPMRGTLAPIDEDHSKIILQPRLKIYVLVLLSFSALLAIINLVFLMIHPETKYLFGFLSFTILSPLLIRLYINSVSSALFIRYKKYMHNAILEAYRSKNYKVSI